MGGRRGVRSDNDDDVPRAIIISDFRSGARPAATETENNGPYLRAISPGRAITRNRHRRYCRRPPGGPLVRPVEPNFGANFFLLRSPFPPLSATTFRAGVPR